MNAPLSPELLRIAGRLAAATGLDDADPEDSLDDMYETLHPGMSITPISADVRIVRYGCDVALSGGDDIVIEQQVGRAWVRVRAYSSLSNDFAHSQSREDAHRLAAQLRGQA